MCNIMYGMCCLQVLFDGLANSKYSMPISLHALIAIASGQCVLYMCTVVVYMYLIRSCCLF